MAVMKLRRQCVDAVSGALRQVQGIDRYDIDLENKRVVITGRGESASSWFMSQHHPSISSGVVTVQAIYVSMSMSMSISVVMRLQAPIAHTQPRHHTSLPRSNRPSDK